MMVMAAQQVNILNSTELLKIVKVVNFITYVLPQYNKVNWKNKIQSLKGPLSPTALFFFFFFNNNVRVLLSHPETESLSPAFESSSGIGCAHRMWQKWHSGMLALRALRCLGVSTVTPGIQPPCEKSRLSGWRQKPHGGKGLARWGPHEENWDTPVNHQHPLTWMRPSWIL